MPTSASQRYRELKHADAASQAAGTLCGVPPTLDAVRGVSNDTQAVLTVS